MAEGDCYIHEGLFKTSMRTRRWFSDLESCSAEHANWRGAMPAAEVRISDC